MLKNVAWSLLAQHSRYEQLGPGTFILTRDQCEVYTVVDPFDQLTHDLKFQRR